MDWCILTLSSETTNENSIIILYRPFASFTRWSKFIRQSSDKRSIFLEAAHFGEMFAASKSSDLDALGKFALPRTTTMLNGAALYFELRVYHRCIAEAFRESLRSQTQITLPALGLALLHLVLASMT
nr:unnamed protein product [Haemonchus contortus]